MKTLSDILFSICMVGMALGWLAIITFSAWYPKPTKKAETVTTPSTIDYQLDLHMDTVKIYDGDRLVGSYISNWNNQMDSIILKDNE